MSMPRARTHRRVRAERSSRAAATLTRYPPGPAYGAHRAPAVRRGAAGRHARADAFASPFVMAKRAGVASLLTALSMGGIVLVQGPGTAIAGSEVGTRFAAVDFSPSTRTHTVSRDAGNGRAAGPATVRSFTAGSTRVAIPKELPVTPARTTAPSAERPGPPPVERKAGPALLREVRVADTLDCDEPVRTTGFANGRIPRADLCVIPGTGQMLRTDAAAAFIGLSAAFRERFGTDIEITDSYRDLASQVALFARKPALAAVPGTSQHGWGIAVDLGSDIDSSTSVEHQWMLDNAPRFGWENPAWARPGGSKLEPWHWEYTAPEGSASR